MSKYILLCITLFYALSTPCLGGTWKDDFNDGDFEGWTQVSPQQRKADWRVIDGELAGTSMALLKDLDKFPLLALNGNINWQSYSVSGRVKWPRSKEKAGIVISIRNSQAVVPHLFFLVIRFDAPSYNIIGWKTIALGRGLQAGNLLGLPLEADVWHEFKLTMRGTHYEIFFNDKLLDSVDIKMKEPVLIENPLSKRRTWVLDYTLNSRRYSPNVRYSSSFEDDPNAKHDDFAAWAKESISFHPGPVGLWLTLIDARFDDVIIAGPDVPEDWQPD